MTTFVCSDIHGNFDAWMRLFKKCKIDFENGDKMVILGDLIDRGNKSLECVQYALELVEKYPKQVVYLRGNHEQMMLNFLNHTDSESADGYMDFLMFGSAWAGNGGVHTFISFLGGIQQEGSEYEKFKVVHELMWKKHDDLINALNKLPYYHITDDFAFVHAGFESGVPLDEQDQEEMIWIREGFFQGFTPVKGDVLEGKTIIHGHTPVYYFENYDGHGYIDGGYHINIDGGSAMNKKIIMLQIDGNNLAYTEEPIDNER